MNLEHNEHNTKETKQHFAYLDQQAQEAPVVELKQNSKSHYTLPHNFQIQGGHHPC